jgi:Flp pilus assembly protein TadG
MRDVHQRRRSGRDRPDERGASAVEFAIIAILLFTLLFGIIEAGWAFSQQLEIRHGAREGARLVAVDFPGGDTAVVDEVCDRMNFSGDVAATTVRITLDGSAIGDSARVTVSSPYSGLTGFLDGIFGSATISSTVDIRLEQVPDPTLGTDAPINCTS